jgi:hypothetical protein
VRAPRPTLKWALNHYYVLIYSLTEVIGTLTHADAPQRGNAPHSALHPALSRFTIDTHMKLFFAGATHAGLPRVREYDS